MNNSSWWNDHQRRRALQLRAQGFSAARTAEILTKEKVKSCTRNMVVGLWSRNPDLSLDIAKVKAEQKAKNPYFIRKKNKTLAKPENTAEASRRVVKSIVSLATNECRFPMGETFSKGFRFCCDPIEFSITKSYCLFHYKMCYIVPRNMPSKAAAVEQP